MNKVKGIVLGIVLAISVIGFCLPSYAQSGDGQKGSCLIVLDGEPISLQGSVYSCTNGQGMQIDTGSEMVTVYGLGPASFWKDAGVSRPVTGDNVTIDGRQVTYSNQDQKIVIMSMTVNGTAITLRDPETGCPLWQGQGKGKGKGKNKN